LFITESDSSVVGAYTGISVNSSTKTLTISENKTIENIYDYLHWWETEESNMVLEFNDIISTNDGINYSFLDDWNIEVSNNMTLDASDKKIKLNGTGNWNLNTSGNIKGIIQNATSARVPLKVKNMIPNSTVLIQKNSDHSVLYKQSVSSSNFEIYQTITSDLSILVRIRNASTTTKYKPWDSNVTLSFSSGASIEVSQQQD
jgi:hypothetical protein